MADQINLHGSCQCGKVQFTATGEFLAFYLCHCSYCRKDSGSAHGANIFIQNGTLEYQQGQENIKHYNVPNTRHTKYFCQHCGCHVAASVANSNKIVVPAGSLDDPPELTPTALIFFDSRAKWVDLYRSDSCIKHAKFPK